MFLLVGLHLVELNRADRSLVWEQGPQLVERNDFLILDETLALPVLDLFHVFNMLILAWAEFFETIANAFAKERVMQACDIRAEILVHDRHVSMLEVRWH